MAKGVRGKFITFEGSEGCGKSTQANLLCRYLKQKKQKVLHVREPGGLAISEKIRKILLDVKNKNMTIECETLLYMAARVQLVQEVILPALKKGAVIICDRFLDSTIAYQGYGCKVDIDFIERIGSFAVKELSPDLTFLLDMEIKESFLRKSRAKDRIEQRSLRYHNLVRRGYLTIAKKDRRRIKVINAQQTRAEIQNQIRIYTDRLLRR